MSAAAPALRLFLALWPDEPARDRLAALQSAWQWPPGAALVPRGKLHVTLHFLGPVPAARFGGLRPLLAVQGEPFELSGEGALSQVWPGGIAVLELQAPPALLDLHAALASALRAQGFAVEERRWRPHVTFARKASGARPPAALPPWRWHADGRWALVRSGPYGQYEVMAPHAVH